MNNTTSSPSNSENYNSSLLPMSNSTKNQPSPGANGSLIPASSSSVDKSSNGLTSTDLQQNLVLYGYILLFLFGYFGQISTIMIFLRQTLRSVSTSCLFICVTISNIIYLSVCIYDFLYVGIGLSPVNSQTNPDLSNSLCRFRSFIQSVAMCSSAWLLVAILIDRWIRIRFPFKVNKLCTRKRVLFGALFILVCAIVLNSHLLLPSLGSVAGVTFCKSLPGSTYTFFFRQVWGILLACLQTVLPTIILLILTIDMYIRLRAQQNQRQRLILGHRRSFVDRQMLIIMLTSIFLFFSTQIPLSIVNILVWPVLQKQLPIARGIELTYILNYVAAINYATTFYLHCLTSGLFRQEFHNILRCCLRRRNGRVGLMPQVRTIEAINSQTFAMKETKVQPLPSIKQ